MEPDFAPKPTEAELAQAKDWISKLSLSELDQFFMGFVQQEYREFCFNKFVLPQNISPDDTIMDVFNLIYKLGQEHPKSGAIATMNPVN